MTLSLKDLRSAFLSYFASHGHTIVPSSPLVPHNDPTLMFTNSGMVQFKNRFTGTETGAYSRATTAQKSVRAGGKHNDLDNVGYTARHHTFFEMLGNFSFGDYFKEDAIRFAWGFLTDVLQLPREKLSFTVYHNDDEAYHLWKSITGCADEKILRIPTSDNFWSMGDTGPCGPCSEIFYDHGAEAAPGEWALDAEGNDLFGDRFIEIWNLVFMQFEQHEDGSRTPLPNPCIDTGMGLERIAAVLQGVHDNYDTDLFRHLIAAIKKETGNSHGEPAAYKVIADHLRSSCFLIADGVLPSNEGRGYVVRRIMRRAMRYIHQLGCKEPVMFKLVPALITEMGEAYPELERARALLIETLRGEEERFQRTLGRGMALLQDELAALPKQGGILRGEVAFKLYDTYGFPLDLTADILRQHGAVVDQAGFDAAMQKQKDAARAAWSGSGAKATEKLWFELKEQHGATEFLGYSQTSAQGMLKAIAKGEAAVSSANAGDEVAFIFNQTPFYGESGGQMGDVGTVRFSNGAVATITDTKKPLEHFHVHVGVVKCGTVRVGDTAELTIDTLYRDRIRANHSATHLLHKALRQVLGEHVTQKGSLVAADRLRFDFSHNKGLSAEEVTAIEAAVNQAIWENHPVGTQLSTPDEAIAAGAMALFGEKYGDEVRVVSMGGAVDGKQWSVELCGGTHVHATGDIGLFTITSESAIAAGVRRIEAATRADAFQWLKAKQQLVESVSQSLKAPEPHVLERIDSLQQERKQLIQDISTLHKKMALASAANVTPETISGIPCIMQLFDDLPAGELREVAHMLQQKFSGSVVALVTKEGGKASMVVGVSSTLTSRITAVDLVKVAAEAAGGKGGGGKPELAQAGSPDASKAADALTAIKSKLRMLAA